jgi:hypothetical protein
VFFSSAPRFSTGAAPKTLVQDKGGVLEHLKRELLIQFFLSCFPMEIVEQSQTDQGLSLFFFSNFSILTLYILASTIQQIENRPTVAVRRLGLTKAPHHHLSTSYGQPGFISKI